MKIILVCMLIMIPLQAMQPRYNPSSLFQATKKKDQDTVAAIILDNLSNPQMLHTMLEWQDSLTRRTALLQAACDNSLGIAELLVNEGANIFATNLMGESPVYRAIYYNQIDMLKILIQTRKLSHIIKIEQILFNKLQNAELLMNVGQVTDLMKTLLEKKTNHVSPKKWLDELVVASRKATVANSDQIYYRQMAGRYKVVAPLLIEHYRNQRNQLIQIGANTNNMDNRPTNYWKVLPADIRHFIIDFLHGSVQMQRQQLRTIQEMPEPNAS